MVIFIEFPVMHWHFDLVLTAQAVMRVYMFHSRQFRIPVMSPFFHPHEPYDDITLDDIHPPFHPLRYLTDGESDSDTRLTPIFFVESEPSESTYLTYSVGSYHLDPSQPSIIRLSSDSSASFGDPLYPQFMVVGSIALALCPASMGMPKEEDVGMMHPVVSRTNTFYLMVDLDRAC